MLSLLAAQPTDEPLCVCDIEASFDLSQPTLSHHLRVLREAGLVTVTRRGGVACGTSTRWTAAAWRSSTTCSPASPTRNSR
jgi:DNA-binding transcriptional ArsR family regulator